MVKTSHCWFGKRLKIILLQLVLFCFLDSWETLGAMPQDRDYSGCVLMSHSDEILLVGSWDSGDRQVFQFECYLLGLSVSLKKCPSMNIQLFN